MNPQVFQKILPASALGISIIIHLCIFLAISGFVLIEAYSPPQAFVADAIQPSNTVIDLPPEPQPEQQEPAPATPTQDTTPQDMIPPTPVTSANVDIIASTAPATTPNFTVAAPVPGAVFSPIGNATANRGTGAAKATSRAMATLFGSLGDTSQRLTGYLYDFKQTPGRQPTNVSNGQYVGILRDFAASSWDENKLKKYFKVEQAIGCNQLFIPLIKSDMAPAAFRAEKFVKPLLWMVHYKGSFVAPAGGMYRFAGQGDNFLVVRLSQKNVFDGTLEGPLLGNVVREPIGATADPKNRPMVAGEWFQLREGSSYPIEILIGDYGGFCSAFLLIQEKGKTYDLRHDGKNPVLPVFQLGPTEMPRYSPEKDAPTVSKTPFVCTE